MEGTPPVDVLVEEATSPFIGRWNRLVSTTNWEKGRILCQWRSALAASGVTAAEFSDEAWARRVGGVSPQHVGRLRRTFERFGDSYAEYEGLYWSHFHAALEFDDAEMWLEGALVSGWSVSQMRRRRQEVTGVSADDEGAEESTAELDEDFEHVPRFDLTDLAAPDELDDRVIQSELPAEPGATTSQASAERSQPGEPAADAAADVSPRQPLSRALAELPSLPDDLHEAFESLKLAIVRHKLDGWREVNRDDVLAALEGLQELALAPSG